MNASYSYGDMSELEVQPEIRTGLQVLTDEDLAALSGGKNVDRCRSCGHPALDFS